MFYTPCEFGGLSNIYIYISICSLFCHLLYFVCNLAIPMLSQLHSALHSSSRIARSLTGALILFCSGQLSSCHSFQPIASGGKRESAPFLPMLPHSLRPFHVCWACDLCPHMVIRRALIRLCDTAAHPSDRTSVCVLRTLATGPASRRVPAGSPRRVNIAAPLRWRGSSMLRVNWAWARRSHCPSTTRWSVRRRYSASPRTEFSRCP